ncbi:MAG: PHP domain-containing protein [Deltaproteobacteria bacterium]|nr:PHP domain-containing protein [Deltaproteobacteria bacterium]
MQTIEPSIPTDRNWKSALIDLHIHTSASDGSYSPREIVHLALEYNIKAIAITDHDTIQGNAEGFTEGVQKGIEVIPGVEISAEWNHHLIHILGYYIDDRSTKLASELDALIRFREERNPKIIEKLNALGLNISYDEVRAAAGLGTIGRPHFAQVLVAKQYAKNSDEAFKKYLQRGASAYAEKKRLTPLEGVRLIREAGGIPVLAHPFVTNGISEEEMEGFVVELKCMGIEGIEVLYPTHTVHQTLVLQSIARKYNLLETGGSDFHGEQKPDIKLARGFGNMHVPYEVVTRMKERLPGR